MTTAEKQGRAGRGYLPDRVEAIISSRRRGGDPPVPGRRAGQHCAVVVLFVLVPAVPALAKPATGIVVLLTAALAWFLRFRKDTTVATPLVNWAQLNQTR